jgi:hypothetical protein
MGAEGKVDAGDIPVAEDILAAAEDILAAAEDILAAVEDIPVDLDP